jgi:predicted transcriptional regulator of viral defense system
LSTEARWLAAVLAAGPRAVLSHRSAAALWGVRQSSSNRVDITIPSSRRSRPGIRFHVTRLPADETASLAAIPVTSVPRTLLDLAAVLDRRSVERAIEQAEVLRLTDPLSLPDLLARYPRRSGVAAIRRVLANGELGTTVTRSELEERFLRFLDERGLPKSELSVPIAVREGHVEVDCVWRQQRLIAELDGRAVHDRTRDRALNAAGWRVIRITWRQLIHEAEELEEDIRTLSGTDPYERP